MEIRVIYPKKNYLFQIEIILAMLNSTYNKMTHKYIINPNLQKGITRKHISECGIVQCSSPFKGLMKTRNQPIFFQGF